MDPQLRIKSLSSTKAIYWNNNKQLHEVLTQEQIKLIKKAFCKNEGKVLNKDQLQNVLEKYIQTTIPEKIYKKMYLQMNISQSGLVSWDEFITYLIIGFHHADVPLAASSLDSPIPKEPRLFKTSHRHPISSISFNYHINPDRSISYDNGWYVTLSKDGLINYWSLDFQLKKTVEAKAPEIRITEPTILSMVSLPDISVIAVGSTQRDLRFYDISAGKFALRVHFVSLEFSVSTMTYIYTEDVNLEAKLLFGVTGGHVYMLQFSVLNRGPFRSIMGIPIHTVRFGDLLKGLYPQFTLIEYKAVHNDWVKQVELLPSLNAILSCSPSAPSLVLTSLYENGSVNRFNINRGVWCFTTSENPPLICTGAADGLVRVWNPYIFNKPIAVLRGHHAGIIGMILQDGFILCSLSMDRIIRVWDLKDQECIQTYLGLNSSIGEYIEFAMFYNPKRRQVLIGGTVLAVISLRPLLSPEQCDGFSHTAAISILLYNPLFQKIVSCGLDSRIILWDPFTGKRLLVINNAHTGYLHGQVIPVEITAATFDVGYQHLLTGAFDGTLKTWHMNTGTCLRNLHINEGCEVTGVCWAKNRILAIGWNRYVIEFPEGDLRLGTSVKRKEWSLKHTGDVLFATAKIPEALATSTYNGELILWALETGQPYKIYSVANPTKPIKITFDFKPPKSDLNPKANAQKPIISKYATPRKTYMKASIKSTNFRRPSIAFEQPVIKTLSRENSITVLGDKELKYLKKLKAPKVLTIRGLAVRCMIFLESRETHPKNATLFVALENGEIQAWSHHPSGCFFESFQATHTIGDYIVAMATDLNNEYLFAGSTEGYIKTFLLKDYLTYKTEKVSLPEYRLKFPFMCKTFFAGRAERAFKNQEKPILLNSYKAHRGIISGLVYLYDCQLLLSSSSDWSIRLWTLGGRYVNTLGTFKPWKNLPSDNPVETDFPHTMPPDLRTIMSSTSYKVFMGRDFKKKLTKKQIAALTEKEYMLREDKIFGKRVKAPILGHYISMSEKPMKKYEFDVKPIGHCFPIYQHLPPVNVSDLPPITAHDRRKTSVLKQRTNNLINKHSMS